jgi:hypothetical protein
MTERATLEDRYRSTFAAMKQAQQASVDADAAQKAARDARREAEERWDAARDELHRWLIGDERPAEKESDR